jgi:hypothetical protein
MGTIVESNVLEYMPYGIGNTVRQNYTYEWFVGEA